ncbi:MAG: ATP-binding cassette domain-containing protein [Sphingomonadales bacterium]|nr:MAG: ATP-binding cassette domain-containing protein [Sphingomonadales bacterium]
MSKTPAADARGMNAALAERFPRPALLSAAPDQLSAAMRTDTVASFRSKGAFAACLFPLLQALQWRGSTRDLVEALPHFADDLDLTDLLNVLAELGYKCRSAKVSRGRFDPRLLPALMVRKTGAPVVILQQVEAGFLAYCSAADAEIVIPASALTGELQAPARAGSLDEQEETIRQENWMGALMRRFSASFLSLFTITAVLNLFALSVSLYMMAIYDRVIPTRNTETLLLLVFGALCLLAVDVGLRQVRARIIAHVGARIESIVATGTFKQIVDLPPAMVEAAPVGTQVSRLREFDSLRDLFTGPVVNVALELPFTLMFLGVIAWLAGPVVWVPVVMLVLYVVLGLAIDPALKRHVKRSSRARAERHEFLIDMFRNTRAIKQLSAESMWLERYREISAAMSHSHFEVTRLTQLLQTLAQAIMVASGVGAVAWSVERVVTGAMTMGGMIAVMSLVWRLLSPMQSLFLALTRLEQAQLSTRQLNQLMRAPTEVRRRSAGRRVERNFQGGLTFDRVSFRYRPTSDPALLGVSMTAAPGQLVAITGGNGAGKSTLLTVALGMNRPQAGAVLIDGIDIRQIDPVELRQTLAYVPQETALFHGTVAQNLRLGNPLAADSDLRDACARLGILDQVEKLPRGFETRLGDQSETRFNAGFRQALAIARALVKRPPIILMDEPAQLLDRANDDSFVEVLRALRGQTTTIMVSHRPSHIALADMVAVLNRGQLVAYGPPEQVLAQTNPAKGVAA